MIELVVAVVGTLGGGLVSLFASLLTLRSTHRSERERWLSDREWEHSTDLAHARRDAYARFLACQNAIILAAAATRDARRFGRSLTHMPPDQVPVYRDLQDAYAVALLLASPSLQETIAECERYLDELIWSSWEGKTLEPRNDLHTELLAHMQLDAIDRPKLGTNP